MNMAKAAKSRTKSCGKRIINAFCAMEKDEVKAAQREQNRVGGEVRTICTRSFDFMAL